MSLDKVYIWVNQAVQEWLKKNDEKKIKRDVEIRLDKHRNEIIHKLLGFNDRWGQWEVDHCNGRAGNSAAGDFLRRHAQDKIEAWFKSQIDFPALPEKAIIDAQAEYMRELKNQLFVNVKHKAKIDAQKIIDDIVISETEKVADILTDSSKKLYN